MDETSPPPAGMPRAVLIADDDPDLRDILRSILEGIGLTVTEAADGRQALQTVRTQRPDLVILDYMMPELTGPEVCDQLKQDLLLRHIPVVMLTGKSELRDKVAGITAGADDYLVKPFEPQELIARVQMVLRRTERDLDANPLTKLPGNRSIQRELERRIASGQLFGVCYLDLNRFKAFNDHYGFQRGDDVIRRTAGILLEAAKREGTPNDFIGHIGGDDFIVITNLERAEPVSEAVIRMFDAAAPAWHDPEDRERGYLLHTDRKGQEIKLPLLSIAIALITNEQQQNFTPESIARTGAELKAYAKQCERSHFVRQRRRSI